MKLLKLLFLFSPLLLLVTPVRAVEDVKSNDPKVLELAKERLNDIANSKTATNEKKAFWGTITSINDNQITIEKNNNTYNLVTTDTTTVINEKRNKAKLDTLKVNQAILAMGTYNNTDNTLATARIVSVDQKTIVKNYQVIVGKIADISKEASVITIIPSKDKDIQYQVKTDNKDLKIGAKVIASLLPDPKNPKSFTAIKIFPL